MDTIGKYQLIRVIGEGGMGRVYEAIDPVIGRRVAIKTISLDAEDSDTRARFFREAQSAGQLSHPNLITIHDIGEVGGMPYIVMEYLEGMDLNRTMRQERLSYDTKIEIMLAVCEGLSFAHGHDVIHRDIKPANIFRTAQGRIKILDFGLARGVVSEVTRTGKVLGTPNYMAPEQIRGDDVDHRADIFSAGVVFYELLTGRKPFEGDSIATTMYKVLETEPPPPHLVDAHLPLTLSSVVNRALAKDRSARYQTSGEMLEAISEGHGVSTYVNPSRQHTVASSPPPATPEPARVRSRRSMIAGGAVAAIVVAGLAGFAAWSRRSSVPAPPLAVTIAAPAPATAKPESAVPPIPAPVPPPVVAPTVPSKGPAATSTAGRTRAAAVPAPIPAEPVRTAPTARGADLGTQPAPPPLAAVTTQPEPKPASPEPRPAPAEPAPAVAPPVVAPPVVAPPVVAPPVSAPPASPAPAPSARAEESTDAAVQTLLARYRTAIEARDIGALKRIWPALSGRQEEALVTEFQHARSITVGFGPPDIRPTGTGATVSCRRNYAVTTADGQTLRTVTTMVMTLARRDGAWSIDTIRHEAAR
jgi:serine/threonine-protein kinase